MGVLRGLAAYQRDQAEQGGKTKWMKLTDGQTVKVHLLDDLDESSSECAHGAGVAVVIPEHKSPSNYMIKMQCSKQDSGRCWACEMALKNKKQGWGKSGRFYINVLVDDGTQDPYVAVWSMGVAKSPVFDSLMEDFIDNGQVANRWYRVKRTGMGVSDTKYSLRPLEIDSEPFPYGDYETYDLSSLVREVPYEEQETYLAPAPADKAEEETAGDEW